MDWIGDQLLNVYDEFLSTVGLFVDLGARAITDGHLSGAEWLVMGLMVGALGVFWVSMRVRK